MLATARHRYAPVEAGARNAEILQAAFDEADDLVAAALRLDEVRVRRVMVEQRLLVFRQPEEPTLLDRPFDRRTLRRQLHAIFAVGQLLGLVIGFVPHRIPTLVTIEVEVPPL